VALAWDYVMPGPSELDQVAQELYVPEDGSAPFVPDWFISLEMADDLRVDIFRLEGMPMEPPFTHFAKEWAMVRRMAKNEAEKLISQALEQERRMAGK
jgi:hypothetical protein